MKTERDDAQQRAKDHLVLLNETRAKLANIEQRYEEASKTARELSARHQHIVDVLTDGFKPPEIDEIRRARGLEPLSTGGDS